jgi:hypothetical protein
MKGIALISGVIFTAILILAIFLAYQMSVPIMQNMKTSAEIEQMKTVFSDIDNIIQAVVLEGTGSRRVIPLKIDYGEMVVNSEKNTVVYSANINFPYISPRTQQKIGNFRFGSNLNTVVNETEYNGIGAFIIENEHLKIYIRKIGNQTNPQTFNTEQILLGLYQKDINKWLNGSLAMAVDNETESKAGIGYSVPEEMDSGLPYGKVTVFINTTYINYYIEFILESGADFVQIRGSYVQQE